MTKCAKKIKLRLGTICYGYIWRVSEVVHLVCSRLLLSSFFRHSLFHFDLDWGDPGGDDCQRCAHLFSCLPIALFPCGSLFLAILSNLSLSILPMYWLQCFRFGINFLICCMQHGFCLFWLYLIVLYLAVHEPVLVLVLKGTSNFFQSNISINLTSWLVFKVSAPAVQSYVINSRTKLLFHSPPPFFHSFKVYLCI